MSNPRLQFSLSTYFIVLLVLGVLIGANLLPRQNGTDWYGYGRFTCYGWPFVVGLRVSEARVNIETFMLAVNLGVILVNLYHIGMCAEIWSRFGSTALPPVYKNPAANRHMMTLVPVIVVAELLLFANFAGDAIQSYGLIHGYSYGFPLAMCDAGVQRFLVWNYSAASVNAAVLLAAISLTAAFCEWRIRRRAK